MADVLNCDIVAIQHFQSLLLQYSGSESRIYRRNNFHSLQRLDHQKTRLEKTVVCVGRFGAVYAYFGSFGQDELFVDIGNVLNPSSGGGSGGNSSAGTGRFGLWKRTISVIKKVPWFGKGLDLYYANNIYDSSLDVPHNEYLAIASNIGIPGLLMYLTAIVWWFVRAIVQKKHLKGFDLVLLATAFAYLISAFFGNSFTYTYPYFLVFFALSIQKDRPLVPKYVKLQSVNDEALSAGAV